MQPDGLLDGPMRGGEVSLDEEGLVFRVENGLLEILPGKGPDRLDTATSSPRRASRSLRHSVSRRPATSVGDNASDKPNDSIDFLAETFVTDSD
jgi:hypothetical protein